MLLDSHMNRSGERSWEIHLGLVHVVALLGIALGCAFGAFYLGFYSGRNVGYDMARAISVVDVPKLPVPADLADDDRRSAEKVARIYHKLTDEVGAEEEPEAESLPPSDVDKSASPKKTPTKAAPAATATPKSAVVTPAPKQGKAVKEVKAEPTPAAVVDKEFMGEEPDGLAVSGEEEDGLPAEAETPPPPPGVRVLGDTAASKEIVKPDQRTLGMLLDERLKEARKEGAQATPRAAATNTPVAAKVTPKATATPQPPKATPTPAKTSAPKEERVEGAGTALPGGWFAQIAAPKKRSEAESIASKLKKAGFPVLIESANVRGESYFRVVVGPEGTRSQAERLVEQLKRESSVSGAPFIRRVK